MKHQKNLIWHCCSYSNYDLRNLFLSFHAIEAENWSTIQFQWLPLVMSCWHGYVGAEQRSPHVIDLVQLCFFFGWISIYYSYFCLFWSGSKCKNKQAKSTFQCLFVWPLRGECVHVCRCLEVRECIVPDEVLDSQQTWDAHADINSHRK